jgi:hypothetical protein
VYDKVVYKAADVRLRAKTFSLPEVQPGSIIEYRYQKRWSAMMLMDTLWSIQREIPMLRASMSLSRIPAEFSSYFTYYNLPAGKVPEKTKRSTYDLS